LVRISFEPSDPLQRVKVSPRASRTLSFHPSIKSQSIKKSHRS